MAEAEFDRTQKLTQQNELIVNDAEHKANHGMQCMSNSEQLAGDPVSEPVSAEDLQVEDLAGPTIEEGIDTLLESAKADADGSKASSQMQKKTTMSSAAGKANGATSSSPTVKKVLNSGTFGVGSAKPSGVKGSMPQATTRPTAPALRKSATSPPATAKPPLTSSTSSKLSAATRRTSIAPTKSGGPPLSKPPLSSLATTKLSTEDVTSRGSPTGSVASAKTPTATPVQGRPRASVSEAVKKAPLTSRPSVASSVKAAPTKATTVASRSSAAPSTKSSRTTGSITSIKEVKGESKEVKGDNKALIQLQSQLEEANKALDVKVVAVADLEGRITILEESLMSATSEVGSKTNFISDLETAKISAESQVADAQEALDKVHEQLTEVRLSLESVEKELESARLATSTQDELVEALRSQIKDLEATTASYDEQINQLKESHSSATSALTESTSIQHESLLKAQADVDTISEELKALRLAHANVNNELGNKVTELNEKTEAVESLQTQLTSVKVEREENVHRQSELEVEVLELKELQEGLEDTRDSFQKRITALEQDLANAASAAECAAEAANKKETDHGEELNTQAEKHQIELEVEAARFANIASALEKLNAEYAEAVAAHEKTKEEIVDKEKQHTASLEEREKSHADAIAALSSQLENVAHELNDQASIYNSKVDAVKAEHAKLLEEVFERAKSEAAQAHGQELQALRSDSNVAIDQIQAANRVALKELKAEQASILESEANSLNKQINNLNVELKATQDDLAKAKAALEASRAELESLTKQRDEARAQAEAVPDISPEHAEEIARLTRELSKTKDDLAATTDALNLTKSSMAELSDKQAAELEAAAKGRADEVLQLRAVHDKEISDLATRKSELLVKLSDLEGELVTAKAALDTHEASSQVNVDGASHPPSSPGVPREELQKLHEAHNLKIHDLEAEHDKAVKAAKEELEGALNKISELEQAMSRKAMEIQYMQQEHEEGQEQITRLREDVETLSEKLAQSA